MGSPPQGISSPTVTASGVTNSKQLINRLPGKGDGHIYGKIFEDIFCSTLMDFGGDTAYVFIAMIVLSDENGVIKHTAESLARVICKDVESVRASLTHLEEQDLKSNLKGHEGRRIVPLYQICSDETRGWLVVNKEHYRDITDPAQRRDYMREYMRKYRKDKDVNSGKQVVSLRKPDLTHTDTDTDTDKRNNNGRAVALPDWLPLEPWEAWLEVRKKNRAPNTPRALRLAITELAKLKASGQDVVAVLEQSTLRGWRGIFPISGGSGVPQPVGEVI
jgi:hypothetical protein